MIHALGRRVLVVEVCTSDDGHGVGYGQLLKRIDRALWYAKGLNADVFYARESKAFNRSVFRVHPADVTVIGRRGALALWLRIVWHAGAPFRLGDPVLWIKRTLGRAVTAAYRAVETSPRAPRWLRRVVLHPWSWHRALRVANAEYARRTSEQWQQRFNALDRGILRASRGLDLVDRHFRLPPEGERAADAQARALGIPVDARIITVHVREHGFRRSAGLRQREWDTRRNARIETYVDAFRALVARGYTVVRLGDATMTPVEMAGVIDLTRVSGDRQWLETWCIMRSAFLIGCDSGPSWLAYLLGVPILTVNAIHFRDLVRPCDRMICKLARERATGRVLTLPEMLAEEYMRHGLDTDRYEHLDNDPQDIADAVIDMIDVVEGREQRSKAQRAFLRRLEMLEKTVPHDWSGLQGVGWAGRPLGGMSRRFAARHFPPAASPQPS